MVFGCIEKKKKILEFIYCHRLNLQAPKSGAPKMRGLSAVAGISGGGESYATARDQLLKL